MAMDGVGVGGSESEVGGAEVVRGTRCVELWNWNCKFISIGFGFGLRKVCAAMGLQLGGESGCIVVAMGAEQWTWQWT